MNSGQPEKFGKYELLKRLAFGGMAEIFLARLLGESGFSKQLVVKRILPQFGEDAQFVKMFIDEAVLAAYINHPNVVQVYDFGSTDNVYFIAMEFVDGADLKQILRDQAKQGQALSPAMVAAIGEGVAAGLASAHVAKDPDGVDLKLVHRDISPHNIMIGRGGEVKVMDFGIARAEVRATKTATGTIKGKVAYMAPEHGSGEKADGRSDQFSLGAVLWEALAGERLYGGDSELEVLRNMLDCRVRDIREVRPDVPHALADVVMRMLSREPAGRFETLLEVRDALSRFRFTLGADGSVDLGMLVPDLEEAGPARPSGTLVLEDPPSPDAVTEPHRGEDASSTAPLGKPHGATATLPPIPLAPSATATLPMEAEAREVSAEKKPSKLWALSLVALIGCALFWISQTGKSRMESASENTPASAPTTLSLSVASEPSGAQVWIDGKQTDLVTPATLVEQEDGASLRIGLRLSGYDTWQSETVVTPDIRAISAQLEPNKPTKPSVKAKAVSPRKIKPKRARAKEAVKEAPRVTSERMKSRPGRLFLRSGGLWFDVFLGGKKLGTTPLAGVSIPSGKHTLILKNGVAGVERRIVVDVVPGETLRRTIEP